ncbi:MAG: hypothetical protein PHO32_09805, partial [Candidatus Cloacimonetes bacterium]|nr:hypothetical protein [Candidatus Cloacimonadota bacterium]
MIQGELSHVPLIEEQIQGFNPTKAKASHAFGLLKASRGMSLIEVLVIALVLVVMITTIYIGAVYAEKQTRHNYRHRVATFLASGEIEKQYVMYLKKNTLQPFTGQEVLIDNTIDFPLYGALTLTTRRYVEFSLTKQYPYTKV